MEHFHRGACGLDERYSLLLSGCGTKSLFIIGFGTGAGLGSLLQQALELEAHGEWRKIQSQCVDGRAQQSSVWNARQNHQRKE
jgi:hypothetical protein